jgi:addiction module HigA family antidote
MKNPPHPGDLIRTEVIEGLGLTVSKAAEILQVRRATLSDLLHGKAALTPEMALRIEKAFGPDMDHLLRMQLAYDVAQTRAHARRIPIKRYTLLERPAPAELRDRLHAHKGVTTPVNTARLVREEREAR